MQSFLKKKSHHRSTCALIPVCGSNHPGCTTRHDEVALRRIRVGAAVRASWTSQSPPLTCPFCPAPATQAIVDHFMTTGPDYGQHASYVSAVRITTLLHFKHNRWLAEGNPCDHSLRGRKACLYLSETWLPGVVQQQC